MLYIAETKTSASQMKSNTLILKKAIGRLHTANKYVYSKYKSA